MSDVECLALATASDIAEPVEDESKGSATQPVVFGGCVPASLSTCTC